jgi:hypothetical protein
LGRTGGKRSKPKKRTILKEEMKMKKLIAALMLVAFFGVTTGAFAAEPAKGDTVKKEEKKCTEKEKKEGKCKEEKKEEPKK